MLLPTGYCSHAECTKLHASLFLEKYGHSLAWNPNVNEVVADVGCANGIITTDVLLPFCKNKISAIIGIDISSDMLRLASERNKESIVSFVEMDVARKNLDSNMVEKFDHIFSFYCLHMIHDLRQCAENLYKMLKPGGEIFLTFNVKNTVIESWFIMCKYDKWAKYIAHFPSTYSQFFTTAHPREDFEKAFRDVGFSVESYQSEPMKVGYPVGQFQRMVAELNVLVSSIPENLREDFLKDHVELMSGLCKTDDSYELHLESIIAIARKGVN